MPDKPQLVGLDVGGIHNADLEASTGRITKGATWKRQRIVVITPAAASIPAKVYLTHLCLGFPPNNNCHRMIALGQEVGEAYSNAIENILRHPDLSTWEYVLTLEHDNCPPPDGVLKLIERMDAHPEFACIGGIYWTKGEKAQPQIWGDPHDPVLNFRPQRPDPKGGLVECCGTGMGFNLWRLEMFKDPKLRKPWFKTQTEGGLMTQDLYMWSDARKHGYRCAVDCSVKVGHYDFEGKFGPPDTMY